MHNQEEEVVTKRKFPKFLKPVGFLLLALALLVLGGGIVLAINKVNPALLSRFLGTKSGPSKEVTSLVAEINKSIDLPTDETPTVATISDVSKLTAQPFFAKAANGDKVLFYTKAKKAYLYRPSAKKIIDVAPLTIEQPSASANPTQKKTEATPIPVRIALLNGTTTPGLTNTFARRIATISGALVTQKSNAKSTNYAKTIVVNLTNQKSDSLNTIAKVVNGTVETLPAGEEKPDADILVILGQ